MKRLTPAERADLYSQAFPHYPAMWSNKDWLLGQWNLGNNYKGSGYYGSYPTGYLNRIAALFPSPGLVLHLFSGSLTSRSGIRVDRRLDAQRGVLPDVQADASALPFCSGTFDLILADPPYSAEDALRYGTCMVDRRRVFAECVSVLKPGGHLVWLDMVHPMYRKSELRLWGEVGITISTNHRYRIVTFFERQTTGSNTARAGQVPHAAGPVASIRSANGRSRSDAHAGPEQQELFTQVRRTTTTGRAHGMGRRRSWRQF